MSNWTQDEMMQIAQQALGKIISQDMRAITGVSVDEITAMAGALIALGLPDYAPKSKEIK